MSRLALQNPEHLLLFAAGNMGDPEDSSRTCTINSPGLGKNVLTVGATSSGPSRRPFTGDDGELSSSYVDGNNQADIDTVAFFSSYGFTTDGRIKPEVVAPGDQVRRWRVFSSAVRHSAELRLSFWCCVGTLHISGARWGTCVLGSNLNRD